MSLNGSHLWCARLAFWLLVLLGMPAAAAAQTVLLDDGAFAQWTTTAVTADQVQGAQDAAIGAAAPSYRVEHMHTSTSSGGFGVGSRSTHTGATFDVSSFVVADRLEIRFDVCLMEPGVPAPLPLELHVTPVVLQGETIFRTTQQVPQTPNASTCGPGTFRRHVLEVSVDDFVSAGGGRLNLTAGAPRVRLGLALQTIWPTVGTARAWLDNLRVRHLPAAGLPVTLALTDRDQGWADEVGETISYDVTVENSGPARSGLVVEMRVPNNTCFSREESTAGWECGPGMSRACSVDGDGLCTYRLQPLATGSDADLSFAVSLQAGVPAQWEFLAEARLLSPSGSELAAEEEITPPVALTGPGCLCLFFQGLCAS